ncbi:TetR/AcrR family transcriptional regulator [Streptomyces antimycoticus]|nr:MULTISPECIES: TetR/AcrR family transcriptional regulator [Streptomyces]MEE4584393.1 helix-turn-helix domain-containing protein [Streptomyces sp. DSM 41602]AJZ84750.1 TetR/AcrR family transcriptional regulator [Streptomyces sp. AgN23]KUL55714.1 TetR family transcriptional regulator [Streptomyces violaceusniger]RSS44641.1 TetR/AcrR family transcriptional regulator [Streptomyces sp. WAC05858]WJE01067.1 helix-turn-helix domain-containing protein [Streptomyces antimycoticus]
MGSRVEKETPLRRDARRNREMLIAAAREIYTDQGVDAPLDDIARRAGVGSATLYRRFAGRAELIEAVFGDSLRDILRAAEEARSAPDAWVGLTAYLERIFGLLAADRGTNDLMTTGIQGVPSLDALRKENHKTLDVLLRRAQQQGAARKDTTAEDLLFLLAALGRAVPGSTVAAPLAWRRYLALLLDGLRPEGSHPLPAPSLTGDQLGAAMLQLGKVRRPRMGRAD